MMAYFFGRACPRAENCRNTSDEIVTVCPNITCPTSMVTFLAALTASANRGAADEKPSIPSLP